MFESLFIIVPIFIVLTAILMIALIVSPKLKGKILSGQMKSIKYAVDESKDDIENISTNMAKATKEGIEITASAIKKGFTESEAICCKHCGSKIDRDSKFCKNCEKKQ